ncbi:MAG: hypothetical protein U1F77_06390 [Kiritimatiellia bacterium]
MKQEPFECGATLIGRPNAARRTIGTGALAVIRGCRLLFIWALGAQPLTGFLLLTLGFFPVPARAHAAVRGNSGSSKE